MSNVNVINKSIVSAIEQQKKLILWYNGGHRIVEPHAYGLGSKGHNLLRCFQIEGHSNSNNPHDWKLMIESDPEKFSQLVVSDETFSGPRPEYRRGDKAMVEIYAQL